MKQLFSMFAAYNAWANRLVYEAAGDLDEADYWRDTGIFFKSVGATLNHVLVADGIWMKRFTGRGEAAAALDTILHREFDPLLDARLAEDERIIKYVADLTEEALAGRFSYVTVTDMRTVSQRLAPALAHLFNHQTHHRGQVHAAVTGLGRKAPSLDMIYFQRTDAGRLYA